MNKLIFRTLKIIIIAFSLLSCSDDKEKILDFTREFATIINTINGIEFELDNGSILLGNTKSNMTFNKGDRAIVTYTKKGDKVTIHSATKIRLLQITEVDEKEWDTPNSAPIYKQAIWCRGKYINLMFDIEYHSKQHSIEVYKNSNEPDNLYLFHSRKDDPPGYMSNRYFSINIDDLKKEKELPTTIYLHIHTKEGEKVYPLELKE